MYSEDTINWLRRTDILTAVICIQTLLTVSYYGMKLNSIIWQEAGAEVTADSL